MGSSTAWELSAAGQNVLLLEQQDSIYTSGSSYGDARISRSLGAKGDLFSWLQQTSVKQTQELLLYLNEADGSGTHSMEQIYNSSPVTYLFYDAQQETIDSILDGQQDPHEVAVGAAQAHAKFSMAVPDSATVIREYKPYSGTLNPRVLIRKLHQGILAKASRIRYGSKVTRLVKKGGVYEVEVLDLATGTTTTLRANKIICAAGPYTGPLLKEVAPYMEDLLSIKRLFLAYLKPGKQAWEALTAEQQKRVLDYYPGIDLDEEIFYTMIEGEEQGVPIFKSGGHFKRSDIADLDSVWKQPLTNDEIGWARTRTLNYWQQLGLPLAAKDLEFHKGYSCVYTLTESEIPLVTPLIANGQPDPSLVVIAGLSGVGAKGALAYGLLAADQILGKTSNHPGYQKAIKMMGPDRLQKDLLVLEKEQAEKMAALDVYNRGFLFKSN